jgi:hypothetical protein
MSIFNFGKYFWVFFEKLGSLSSLLNILYFSKTNLKKKLIPYFKGELNVFIDFKNKRRIVANVLFR